SADVVGMLTGGALVVMFGLVDDKKGLSPSYKFLGQVIAAILFLILSHNAKILSGSGWDILILLLWMVGLMNAINFLDAMDGLCAGISFISASAFLIIAFFNHQIISPLLALALMGGLLGFLRYNFTPAKIFLGDAGSMFNGYILACLGILFARENTSYSSLLVPILILSYPIFDISFVTLIRLREGRKVYVGDYNNSPRRIANLGVQNKRVVLWIYFFVFLLGGLGVLVYFFFDSPVRMLIAVFVWLVLVIFGVHLQRNFVNIKEKFSLIFADTILINGSFLFFFWLRFKSGIFPHQMSIPLSEYAAPAIWVTIYWLNLFAILGLYEVPGDVRFKDEVKSIAKAVGAGIIIFLILSLNPAYLTLKSWSLLSIYSLSLLILLGIGRGSFILLTRKLHARGRSLRKAIIVGTKENARGLFEKISSNPHLGYQVVGLVGEDEGNPKQSSSGLKVLGKIEELDEITREKKIQDILIALEPDWKGSLQELMNRVSNLEVSFKIVPHLADLFRGYQTAPLATNLLLRIFPSQMRTWEWTVKRLFDALISMVVLIMFLPIWILLGILIKLNFKGSPLVKRGYLGKAGGIIGIYKFKVSKEEPAWENSSLDSKSPTGILGKFLRSTGLEKIPIFLNILRGEMSLVGPEPLRQETFEKLSSSLPLLPKRLYVKPGLFSLAKIKGKFKDYMDGAKECLLYDLHYIENMSLYFDTKIFL
ncbi:MAG: sugar transferase, partial [Candidatus Zixiibacteriota bacterium]